MLSLVIITALLSNSLATRLEPKKNLLETKAVPALQPADVFDSDFPVDMAQLTPQELRYKAQANYAKAVAALKKEAAEAEAARKEMERLLKEYEAAAEAARRAKADAEALLKSKNSLSDAAVDADTKAKLEKAEAMTSKDAIAKAQADLDAANKAVSDAEAGKLTAAEKIAALKAQHEKLCAEIKKLDDEARAAGFQFDKADSATDGQANAVDAEAQQMQNATMKAKMEKEEAQKAMDELEAIKARLAKAEAASKGSGKDAAAVKAEIAKEKKEYERAKETYTKEANDVKAAQKRVDEAKAELAKWEPRSGTCSASVLVALALAALSFA
jgi:chromosome segregation ATPase